MRLAGMVSGPGRNLLHVADRRPGGAAVAAVFSNEEGAPALEGAAERGIPTEVVEREAGEPREAYERRLLERLGGYDADLVCLDGTWTLASTFLDAAPTTLDVHPSLLPAFPGPDAHRQALDAGVRVTGCTVHVVTPEGAGPIVTQEAVPVYEGDTAADLERRVRHEGEFRAYPRAVQWFAEGRVEADGETVRVAGDEARQFPGRRVVSTDRVADLRYGENPHQAAALYADAASEGTSVVDAAQLNEDAKALSYNNYNDADAALNLLEEFDRPAATVVKHTNPAGCALAGTPAEAYDRALSTDPMSAFGGVVGLNRECDAATARRVVDSFKEVVAAPGYTDPALDVLCETENLRVLDVGRGDGPADESGRAGAGERPADLAEKPLVGGRLVQERDRQRLDPADLDVVTEREPTDAEVETMLFAWQTVKHVKSNAIVFATGTETVGVGAGQMSRVDAVHIARRKADEHAEGKSAAGGAMASDAFFPFPDGIEAAAEAGIEAVVQPGGSVNDEDVIRAADEHGMTMVFTGRRAFRHD